MNSSSLVVAVIGPNHKQERILTQLGGKLRRRGLRVRCLRNWHDDSIGDFDILLMGSSEKELVPFTKQLEHLWTQKWNRWYTEQNGRTQKERARG